MEVLRGILSESKKYYYDIERRIKKRLLKLPKGSVKARKINGKKYYYLQQRVGKKVVHKYVGKVKPIELINNIKERRKLMRDLKIIMQNKEIVERTKFIKNGKHNK